VTQVQEGCSVPPSAVRMEVALTAVVLEVCPGNVTGDDCKIDRWGPSQAKQKENIESSKKKREIINRFGMRQAPLQSHGSRPGTESLWQYRSRGSTQLTTRLLADHSRSYSRSWLA